MPALEDLKMYAILSTTKLLQVMTLICKNMRSVQFATRDFVRHATLSNTKIKKNIFHILSVIADAVGFTKAKNL